MASLELFVYTYRGILRGLVSSSSCGKSILCNPLPPPLCVMSITPASPGPQAPRGPGTPALSPANPQHTQNFHIFIKFCLKQSGNCCRYIDIDFETTG